MGQMPEGTDHERGGAEGLLSCMSTALLTGLLFLLLSFSSIGKAIAAEPEGPFPLEPVFNFGPDGSDATNFNKPSSVALDQQRELVYVLEETGSEAILLKYGADGEPVDFEGANPDIEGNRLKGLSLSGFALSIFSKVAVDSASGVIYVIQSESVLAFDSDGEPAEFTAGPGAGSNEIPGLGVARSVAVDSNGSIYVADGNGNAVNVFAATGQPLTSFAVANPRLISVAPDGAVYVIDSGFSAVKRFTPSGFPVSLGTTYPGGATFASTTVPLAQLLGLNVDPDNGDVYALETNSSATWIRRWDVAGTLVESLGAPGSPTESEAFGGGSSHIAAWGEAQHLTDGGIIKLYLGDQEVNKAPLRSRVAAVGRKIVLAVPEITKSSVLDVTADSAKLRAWIDPGNLETSYHFEYGLEDCAVSVTPCATVPLGGASVGDGKDPIRVAQPVFGLEPDTTYHYRVLAENSLGPAATPPSQTFTTQPLGLGYELIDSRAWEMVSPSDKGGAQLKGAKGGLIQAASDGERLAYVSLGSIDPEPQGHRAPEFSAALAQRGANGWGSRDISSANSEVIPIGSGAEGEFKSFSLDLTRGVLMPRGATLLSPQASERTPYLREEGASPIYTPLLSGKEGFANVPEGTKFGGSEDDTFGEVVPAGATPDLSHVVLRSELSVPLVEGFPVPGPPFQALYLWTGGQLGPISVLPSGEGGSMASGPVLGSSVTTIQNAISTDGSRVFWGRSGSALYVRDTLAEETTRLDVTQGGSGTGGASPIFQGASADGTAVFFKDTRDLTEDASPAGSDLYRCEIPAGSPSGGCAGLTNVSAPLEGPGESAEVLGVASGLSEDGTRIYFVAKGVLDKAENQFGDSAVAGSPNLYLWEEGEGTRFIAGLDEEDKGNWGLRGTIAGSVEASKLNTAISPSGRYLAFMSQRSLSGQPNLDEQSGEPVQEVFRYDAETDKLVCVSCNPFGAAPEATEPAAESLVNPHGASNGALVAATLPAGYLNEARLSLYRARGALDNGRIFFNAHDALVPADSNGEWDVYQWEPSGVGDCSASSGDGATVRSAGGCVSLLSSGTGEEEAAFLDADPSGDDVFFLTPARLSVTDTDKALDVYDARVNGVVATLPPQVECEGEACHRVGPPPARPIPGSATFNGPGNPPIKPKPRPKPCQKGKQKKKVKGKTRCVPKKQGKSKGKASKNRGAGR